jgi:hypothetical protein
MGPTRECTVKSFRTAILKLMIDSEVKKPTNTAFGTSCSHGVRIKREMNIRNGVGWESTITVGLLYSPLLP